MRDPLAFFLTFTTYGTWLRGDQRGWVEKRRGEIQPPDPIRVRSDRRAMKHDPVILTPSQREIARAAMQRLCEHRAWTLHAVNVRSNHVHLVVSAPVLPQKIMIDCKAYATRALRADGFPAKATLWTEGGSKHWLNDEESLERACLYVENQ